MVGLEPGLHAELLVLRHQENDILSPVILPPEELGRPQQHRDRSVRAMLRRVGRSVRHREDEGLSAGGPRCPQDRINILPGVVCVVLAEGVVEGEVVGVDLEAQLSETRFQPREWDRVGVLLRLRPEDE